jgi:Fe-S-cluster-containing hydrogenase component 2
LMVSLDSGDDLHFRKAEIDYKKCINCLECINSCPSKALYSDNSIQLNKNNCVGCGRCSEACLQNAINFIKLNNSLCHCEQSREPNFLTKCQKRRGTIQKSAHGEWIATSHPTDAPRNDEQAFKAIEIHTGNNSIEEVKSFLELNASLLKNIELLSFCVESKRFNPAELQNYANSLTKLVNKKVIIQIDGIPMGATDKPCSSLQTVSAAAILLENKLDAYIQLSGGTNHLTKKLVSQLGLKISGIGYGTFARKLILSYLDELEENFFAQLQRIVNITTSLVDN